MNTEFEDDCYRVYNAHPDRYVAICRIQPYCDVGIVSMMHGDELLMNLAQDLANGKLSHFRHLEGYVLKVVARAIELVCERIDGVRATFHQTCFHHGREFIWARVERI